MTTWPVLVQHWQIDCCGDRFAIGDEVAWTLALSTDDAGTWGWPEAMLIELQATGRRSALSDTGQAQMILSVDGVEVAVDGGVDRPLCGALIEQHHGGVPAGVLPVSAVVRRIRVVSQKFRSSGNRSWVPVPGVVQFREVLRVPDAFALDECDGTKRWNDLGVLADIELRDESAGAPRS